MINSSVFMRSLSNYREEYGIELQKWKRYFTN
jgi:hypothetical protein